MALLVSQGQRCPEAPLGAEGLAQNSAGAVLGVCAPGHLFTRLLQPWLYKTPQKTDCFSNFSLFMVSAKTPSSHTSLCAQQEQANQ